MGTKLPSTLLTKYHKLNKIHSRVLGLNLAQENSLKKC